MEKKKENIQISKTRTVGNNAMKFRAAITWSYELCTKTPMWCSNLSSWWERPSQRWWSSRVSLLSASRPPSQSPSATVTRGLMPRPDGLMLHDSEWTTDKSAPPPNMPALCRHYADERLDLVYCIFVYTNCSLYPRPVVAVASVGWSVGSVTHACVCPHSENKNNDLSSQHQTWRHT